MYKVEFLLNLGHFKNTESHKEKVKLKFYGINVSQVGVPYSLFPAIYPLLLRSLPLFLGLDSNFFICDATIRSGQPVGLPHSPALPDFC